MFRLEYVVNAFTHPTVVQFLGACLYGTFGFTCHSDRIY